MEGRDERVEDGGSGAILYDTVTDTMAVHLPKPKRIISVRGTLA